MTSQEEHSNISILEWEDKEIIEVPEMEFRKLILGILKKIGSKSTT